MWHHWLWFTQGWLWCSTASMGLRRTVWVWICGVGSVTSKCGEKQKNYNVHRVCGHLGWWLGLYVRNINCAIIFYFFDGVFFYEQHGSLRANIILLIIRFSYTKSRLWKKMATYAWLTKLSTAESLLSTWLMLAQGQILEHYPATAVSLGNGWMVRSLRAKEIGQWTPNLD